VAHPTCFIAARAAGQKVGLTDDFLILLEKSNLPLSSPTIEQLVMFGSSEHETFKPLLLKAGEAKTTLAFLSFSSGTTGKSMFYVVSSDYHKLHTSSNRKTQGTTFIEQCRVYFIYSLGRGYISLWSDRECNSNGYSLSVERRSFVA
jgi:hypothetical protein